ncbi:YraN family protein [Euzebya sp.]|uniref:YraN family protein n=1 Tax=Euzebya sp. TaxID=1971409 RepID=UPI003517EFF8
MHRRQRLGATGEDLAAAHLTAAGLTIRHRNWRVSSDGVRGELDLVAVDGETLVVGEVRTRSSRVAGTPAESVSWDKRRRLRRLAAAYLHAHPHHGPVRGDVVGIELPPDSGSPRIRHLRGVW